MPLKKRGPRARSRHTPFSSEAQSGSTLAGAVPIMEQDTGGEIPSRDSVDENRQAQRARLPVVQPADDPARAHGITVDAGARAASLLPTSTSKAQLHPDPRSAVEQIWQELLVSLASSWEPEALIGLCIDAYMVHLFPITPLVHEPSARAIWSWAFGYGSLPPLAAQSPAAQHYAPPVYTVPKSSSEDLELAHWAEAQSLTLLTALCATSSLLVPETTVPKAREVAMLFLQASRKMHRLYPDQEIERTNAYSIIIRYFHAISIHATGNARMSWYLIGEAIRLAQELRLYEEDSLAGLDPLEAHLRRAVFWQLYTGDQSAAILNNRPLTLHRRMLDAPLSTRYLSDDDIQLMDPARHPPSFARHINTGFTLGSRLFSLATDIFLDLKLLVEFFARPCVSADLVPGLTSCIVDSSLAFLTVLDDMPECLQHPGKTLPPIADEAGGEGEDMRLVTANQRISFWAQHVNLKVTYWCLRLIMLQRAADLGFAGLLGFSEDPRLLSIQKTEISREVLACIQAAPFEALQVNGESCVEKIRQVGASLLQVSQSAEPRAAARAKADFRTLLNILARLDSKASDALYRDVGSPAGISLESG